jgi:ABC-type bacteriocin/lantibiotic exporter with double-glycine peptidase domain
MASYQVYHNVPHVRQPESNACWFACLAMIVRYWREYGGRGELVDPGDDALAVELLRANRGINWNQASYITQRLHISSKPVGESLDALYQLLSTGPVIFAGIGAGGTQGHWVVFRGMCENILWINDPRFESPTQEDYFSFMNQAPPWNRAWFY